MEANFTYRPEDGTLLPRLVANTDPNSSANNSNTSEPNVQTVTLASPLNGQFYVIGSPGDLLGAGALNQRSIAPRTLTLEGHLPTSKQVDSKGSSITDKIARQEKIGNRRATHNEVERRRRDNINHWIMKVGKLIPQENDDDPLTMNGNKQALSKGGILAKACEYLTEIRDTNNFLRESLADKDEIVEQNMRLQSENQKLQLEVAQLRSQLNMINNQMDPKESGLLSDSPPPPSGQGSSGSDSPVHSALIKRDIHFGL